jgi:2-polyprenyl-3-methyl-5-hydroxy-6-metoxy-1,4-benzoquinol methylase
MILLSYPSQSFRFIMEENLHNLASEINNLDEQAVPSYLHSNKLMAWLFWQRLKVVINYLDTLQIPHVLDFGCGSGVMFPYLIGRSESVVGYDIDLRASQYIINQLDLSGIQLINSVDGLNSIRFGSIDTILALDVLEHIDNLEEVLLEFERLLSKNGHIIVSGPTETFFYRLGRKMAGFKRNYHVRNIYDIEKEIQKFFYLQSTISLFPPITLFRIVVGRRL